MTAWHRGELYAFDLETTGIDVNLDRIVTATVARIRGADVDVRSWLVNPGIPIPTTASNVHGVTTEQAIAQGMSPHDAVLQIAGALARAVVDERPVVAFNGSYDFTLFDREARRHGVAYGQPYVIDPFVIDKHLDKYRKGKRTLTACCEHYQVRLDGAHDATADALAAARVAWRMATTWPDELQVPLPQLHANQAQWRAEWARDFQTYLRKKDPTAVVCGEWPVQSLPAGWSPEQVPAQDVAA